MLRAHPLSFTTSSCGLYRGTQLDVRGRRLRPSASQTARTQLMHVLCPCGLGWWDVAGVVRVILHAAMATVSWRHLYATGRHATCIPKLPDFGIWNSGYQNCRFWYPEFRIPKLPDFGTRKSGYQKCCKVAPILDTPYLRLKPSSAQPPCSERGGQSVQADCPAFRGTHKTRHTFHAFLR